LDAALVTAFFAAAIPSFFTPGPNNLMLMTSAARFGIARTVPHMVGICLGFPLMVAVVGLGLGEVFEAFPVLKTILKFAAAAYFLWMAWTLLGLKLHDEASSSQRPMRAYEAALFQWINPKAWAMAVALVALVVGTGTDRIWSIGWVTLGCLLIGPFSSGLWMVGGQQLEAMLRRTNSERFLGAIMAILMVIAVILFLL
jgi:threonine/homoserine/homoserine lactone efflux protein